MNSNLRLLDQPMKLDQEKIHFYRTNGYIKLKEVLSPEIIHHYGEVIEQKVKELNTMDVPLEERNTYDKAFLQIMNVWRQSREVATFVAGKRLARIAAELMGVKGVRLYHDQALFKEPGGGFTPWHADQYYWPLANDHTITAWIPLQATPLEMGPLEFSAGSQRLQNGRDYKISDDSEQKIGSALRLNDFKTSVEAFEEGEVSFHSGWTFHRAGPNTTKFMRKAMTIIYMDSQMTLKDPENENQQNDWEAWCPEAAIGEIINTPLNPILYP